MPRTPAYGSIPRARALPWILGLAMLVLGGGVERAEAAAAVPGVWAVAGDTRTSLSWETVVGATEYRVYESTSAGTLGPLVATVPAPGTSVQLTGRTNGTGYYYTVRSWDGAESVDPVAELTPITTLPSARWSTSGCSATIDGIVYLFGGDNSSATRNAIVAFDPQTGLATTIAATLPANRAHCTAAAHDGSAYIFGGSTATWANGMAGTNTIWKFTPGVGVAAQAATLPTARWGFAAATLDDQKIYLHGGRHSGTSTTQILAYDPVADTAPAVAANYGTARVTVGVAAIWGNSFSFGGLVGASNTNQVASFDAPSTLTAITTTPTARGYLTAGSLNEMGYTFGGYEEIASDYQDSIWRLDPATSTVTTIATVMPATRSDTAVERVRGSLYVLGGDSDTVSNQVLRFQPGGQARATPAAPASVTAPSALSGTLAAGTATLSWTAGTNVRWYRVFRSTVSGQRGQLIEEFSGTPNAPRTSLADAGLGAGPYYYTLDAVGFDDRVSASTAQVTVAAAVTAPTSPSAAGGWNAVDQSNVLLSWTAPAGGATSYNIRWSVDAYASVQGSSVTTTYTKASLAVNTAYTFKICSVNAGGVEETTCSAAVSATTPPAPPTGAASLNITDAQVDFSWTTATGATSTELRMFTDGACSSLFSTDAAVASPFTKAGLSRDRPYWYQLRSFSTASSAWGAPTACIALSGNGRTSLTIGFDATSLDFGTVLPGATGNASTTITTQTYGATGYQILASAPLPTSGANTVPGTTSGTVGSPAGASAGAWTGAGFGFTVATGTNLEAGWGAGTKWARFNVAPETIHATGVVFAPNTANSTTTRVDYRVTIPASQPAGAYTTSVVYTAVATP